MEKVDQTLGFFMNQMKTLKKRCAESEYTVLNKAAWFLDILTELKIAVEQNLSIEKKRFFWLTLFVSFYFVYKLNQPIRDLYLSYSSVGQWSCITPLLFMIALNNGPMRKFLMHISDLRDYQWSKSSYTWFGVCILIMVGLNTVFDLVPWVPSEFWYFPFDLWIWMLAFLGMIWLWLLFVTLFKVTGALFGFFLCEKCLKLMGIEGVRVDAGGAIGIPTPLFA